MACYNYIKVDTKEGFITVPCGNCPDCLKKRRVHWSFRLMYELKNAKNAYFVTLTYQDGLIPIINGKHSLYKEDVKKAIRKLKYREKNLRYYLVGEYGRKGRPHYHAILFNVENKKNILNMWDTNAYKRLNMLQTGEIVRFKDEKRTRKQRQEQSVKVPLGMVHVGQVTEASIMYTTKYCIQMKQRKLKEKLLTSIGQTLQPSNEYPFSIMSKGLGEQYIEKMKDYHNRTKHDYITFPDGKKQSIPKYYRQKIFNKFVRDKLNKVALTKADEEHLKEVAKKGSKAYFKALQEIKEVRQRKMIKNSKSGIL